MIWRKDVTDVSLVDFKKQTPVCSLHPYVYRQCTYHVTLTIYTLLLYYINIKRYYIPQLIDAQNVVLG